MGALEKFKERDEGGRRFRCRENKKKKETFQGPKPKFHILLGGLLTFVRRYMEDVGGKACKFLFFVFYSFN